RDAIGAEITLTAGSGRQYATVSTTGSYLSASDKRVHFGLGAEATIQKLEIRWPSGVRQTLTNVAADQVLQVDEPAATEMTKP
ncbi:MAG TPA: ASPIC/UnbV domain-containing protein, partial [Terriglobales bacterium]|nr:ASPIC/UnbV domain-containing protein [Terriglobales bacterium]